MRFLKITNKPVTWNTEYKPPKPAPTTTRHIAQYPLGVRTQEQMVARMIYYAVARVAGVTHPPSFSTLNAHIQQLYVSAANEVMGYLETQIVEE